MQSPTLSRRLLLGSAAALPLVPAIARVAQADGHAPAAAPMPHARSFNVGEFRVTSLLDGMAAFENPQETFGMNVSADEFAEVSAANFIPADGTPINFLPVLVEAGEDVILFDTGLGNGGIETALAEVGRTPDQITHVVISHFHGDHVGGLLNDGAERFANAAYLAGQVEFDHWTGPGAESRIGQQVAESVAPLAEKMSFMGDGATVRSGITAVASYGHTPGHLTFRIESAGQQIHLCADLANHHVWSLAHPDWEVRFDVDKEAAAASRRQILGMLAADRVAMMGYHLPWPGAGYIETRGDGFHWVPVSYQFG